MSKKIDNDKDDDIIVPSYCNICLFDGKKCKFPDTNFIGCGYGRPTQQAIQWAFEYVNFMTNNRLKVDGE